LGVVDLGEEPGEGLLAVGLVLCRGVVVPGGEAARNSMLVWK
jgi:hypothetical protein